MVTTPATCNTCSGETTHDVLHSEKTRWEAEQGAVCGGETYETLRCCGCKTIRLRLRSWCSEDDEAEVYYFPPAITRRRPDWFQDLWRELEPAESFLENLMEEIYTALQNNLPRLAAMGVRALLEQVMIAKAGDKGTFGANLTAFEKLGHVSSKQKERLEAILDAGHAAIHRGYEPRPDELVTLLDIAEHIIESIWLHDKKVAELRKRVPPRRQRSGA
jgi:hypothetical protein